MAIGQDLEHFFSALGLWSITKQGPAASGTVDFASQGSIFTTEFLNFVDQRGGDAQSLAQNPVLFVKHRAEAGRID